MAKGMREQEDGGCGEPNAFQQCPAMISYAQNLEDVLLHRALSNIEKGFYIDVGAQDPVDQSVTKFFYERGWRGINIEPVAHWFEKLESDRPEDINLRIALGSRPSKLPLFEIADTGLSTTVPHIAALHRRAGYALETEQEIEADTLDAVCARHGVDTVHFLKIDVEGAEADVLRGLSLDRIRPWIIVVEATLPNSQETTHQEWEHHLTGHRYAFAWFDGLNRYFVADEHADLRSAFDVQPNVFDRYVRYAEATATERAAELDRELRSAREENRLLLAECNRHSQETAQLRAKADRIADALARTNTEISHLREELAQAKHRQRIAELEHTTAGLRDEIIALRQSTSWRLTAPVRAAKTAYLTLRGAGIPADRGKAAMQAHLHEFARRAAAQPRLRGIAVALLGRHPALKRRLAAYLAAMPDPSSGYSAMQLAPPTAPPLGTDSSDAQCQAWSAFSRAMAGKERP